MMWAELGGLPRRARVHIVVTVCAAALVTAIAIASLGRSPPTARDMILTVVLAAAVFGVQLRAPSLLWRGRRIAIHPDEAIIYLAFVLVPSPLVILGVLCAGVAAQAAARKPLVKLAFNGATHALAAGAGALAVAGAAHAGLGPAEAALVAPLVVSAVGQMSVALLLSVLAGDPWRAAIRPELGTSIAISGIAGTTLGALAVALFQWHPLATLALAPVAFLTMRVLALEYRHRNELSARRSLATASARIASEASEGTALDAARAACFDLFDPSRCTVRLSNARTHEWHRATAHGRAVSLATPLCAPGGDVLGELEVVIAAKGRARLAEDRELLALVGSYLGMALASVRAAEAQQRAAQLIGLKDLVKGIAHEINNPLMYASASLDLATLDLEDDLPIEREQLIRSIQIARRGLTRIETISRALADVGRDGLRPVAAVDIGDVVRDVASACKMHAQLPNDAVFVRGNSADLRAALMVLARNAVEAEGEHPPRITTKQHGGAVEVCVIDSGRGVSTDAKPHLFAPFFTTKPDGVGLSLATALRIARDHGGDIAHEDVAGGGACFRMRIPTALAGQRPRASPP